MSWKRTASSDSPCGVIATWPVAVTARRGEAASISPFNSVPRIASVAVTCPMCDHKWDVPFAMQGKNVLCPECRHRVKVPEQKVGKVDWRDPNAGGRIID